MKFWVGLILAIIIDIPISIGLVLLIPNRASILLSIFFGVFVGTIVSHFIKVGG